MSWDAVEAVRKESEVRVQSTGEEERAGSQMY